MVERGAEGVSLRTHEANENSPLDAQIVLACPRTWRHRTINGAVRGICATRKFEAVRSVLVPICFRSKKTGDLSRPSVPLYLVVSLRESGIDGS